MEEKNKKELIELVKSLQKEKQDLEKAYIELDLECRDLRTENEELKSPKFASWKLKFFNLKDELKKELAEHEEFTKKAKAEIERLTEENKQLEEEIDLEVDLQTQRKRQIIAESQEFIYELANKNAELQKQVDELEERAKIDLENERNWGKIQTKQAVKDTAKEILQMLYDDRNGYWDSCDCGKDETYWRDNSIQGTLNEIKERYGVEVE